MREWIVVEHPDLSSRPETGMSAPMQEQGVRNIDRIENGDRLFMPRVPSKGSVDGPFYNQNLFLNDPHRRVEDVLLAWRNKP